MEAQQLDGLMLKDRRRIEQRLRAKRDVSRDLVAAEQRVAARRAAVPRITYPDQLPVSQARDELLEVLREHQVVVVAGETGSGKTTQLPKMLLELGRGVLGTIGHTQPRRIAARTVAERIAEELDTTLGEAVGYKVRFHDQVGDTTLVKLMTDGILLAEIQQDRSLLAYDTLVVDEAHERSLNVDFLLGYLKQLLPRRPDLKLVITSATINPGQFAAHFSDAPVVEVSGRTYPVEVRYRPPDDDTDQVQAIAEAVEELEHEAPGDVLVFLSGEREIRDTAEVLRGRAPEGTEVLPLYGRLSVAEQHKVFETSKARRRVVLATNVAETSLTVPGIRYVVDPGTARISRYSARTKVQRLPIERISQASARQRAGRCGRVAEGICIRLYDEEDYDNRPEYTDPEILRTNLASVILQMTAIGLGDIAAFPFLDPPDRRNIKDGLDLLHELGALDDRRRLTQLGRRLAQLPIDPRLARMVVEANEHGALREVLVIAAAMSIQDPRERPTDKQQQAAEMHNRFADPTSDFLTYLNLWNHISEQQKTLSSSAFRRLCRTEFLNWLRIREWQDLHSQLRRVARSLDLTLNSGQAAPDLVHLSLLAGLLSHIGLRDPDKREYVGARGARFAVVPGSALHKKQPQWVMAGELVETNRMWGRVLARIAPEWAEQLAPHLVTRVFSEPHWAKKQGAVMAYERVTLYGVPLVARRKVGYARVDPVMSRDLFLRHALVEGDWETHHAFFVDNLRLLEDVEELEHRARRRGIVVDDQTLFEFYDARIPADVVSGAHFDAWWKNARRETPDLLTFSMAMLVQAEGVDPGDYPDVWQQGELRLPLTYQFEPGSDADGVTVHVPVAVLPALSPYGFDWQVPGLREELVTALIKSLPKPTRVKLVPAPDTARALLAVLEARQEPLLDALERELLRLRGVDVRREEWQLERVPDHLRITFRVEDADGRTLAEGKELAALRAQLAAKVQQALSSAAPQVERSGLTSMVAVPQSVPAGTGVTGYPALVDKRTSVSLQVLGSPAEQGVAMWSGIRRLLWLNVPSPVKAVAGSLSNAAKLALSTNPHGSVPALLEDCVTAAIDALMRSGGGVVWDEAGFGALRDHVRGELVPTAEGVVRQVEQVLSLWQALRPQVQGISAAQVDMRAQLDALVFPGFVTAAGADRLPDLVRYLTALQARLSKLPASASRDTLAMTGVHAVQDELAQLRARRPYDPRVDDIRWMVEELRVSLFAQGMRTKHPVSEKRIYRAIDDLTA
ncbi:MAG: ATP-dependent RNA helicase HrpA [Actinobacteria bacterium]|nr:ATP-dependent RNA helicase HrpA [Actinomycetota bacterium]